MNVLTIYGTRPEFIRLSVICKELDRHCDLRLLHTGQNYDPNLDAIFFDEMGLRPPDIRLGIKSIGFAEQAGAMLPAIDEAISRINPDRIVVLGDTNSTLAASIVAARRGVPTFHLEAGNRCFDDRVPEEVNRRIIDHTTTVQLPYTHRSKENLVREGIERSRIFVTGNPIYEVILAYEKETLSSGILEEMSLTSGQYMIVTMHRAENVDEPDRLASLLSGLTRAGQEFKIPIVLSMHPRTADRIRATGADTASQWTRIHEPFGFFDFIQMERNAMCAITDSGTVQEECCILGVPNVTIRDTTERPETVECGSNILAGAEPEALLRALHMALDEPRTWNPPAEYLEKSVSKTVANIVLGYQDSLTLRN